MSINFQQDHNFSEDVQAIIKKYPDKTGQTINVLNDLQAKYRYLPEEALQIVSAETGIPFNRLISLGTFFSDLSIEPVGKYILEVCDGTACHAVGAPKLLQLLEDKLGIKEGKTTEDGVITLRKVNCVGACSQAPIIIADGETYGRVKLNQVIQIAKKLNEKAEQSE